MRTAACLLLLVPGIVQSHPCESCHAKEVAAYLKTGMGRSLREPAGEPDGALDHTTSGTKFLIRSSRAGTFQRMQHDGENSDYRIDYVIGSGSHASCYLARVGDHLFESPICYYPGRGYAMAPGYQDNAAPGYTRPITMECVLCHSGKPLPIPASLNRYESPAFAEEAISCERCHGDTSAHLKRPVAGSIVNPAKLPPAQRDSVCERCHLSGVIRVLNPGKSLTDYHPGQTLEGVFTTYVAAPPENGAVPLKVVSQSEQLAASRCSVASSGKMWCGSCHDPHSQPADNVAYYRSKCLSCHRTAFPQSHPDQTSNCLTCHMPRREAEDGGHTAFTDHRILRRPRPDDRSIPVENIRPWREPSPEFRARNFALALNYAGVRDASSALTARSYPLLLDVQKSFPKDPDVMAAIGTALLDRKQPAEAAKVFEQALKIRPDDASLEDNAGTAWLDAGDAEMAARHFEAALKLDPLLLPDIEALLQIYPKLSEPNKVTALMDRVHEAMKTGPAKPNPSGH